MSWVGRDREGSEGTGGREGRTAANPSGLGQDTMPARPPGFVPSDLQISHSFIHSFSEHHWEPTRSEWLLGTEQTNPGAGPGSGWMFRLQRGAFVLL